MRGEAKRNADEGCGAKLTATPMKDARRSQAQRK
jgi:hypothetical protein